MSVFVTYLALLSLSVVVIYILATWISSRYPKSRNLIAFLVAAIASYSVGFVLDISMQAVLGTVPAVNIIAPMFTWSAITIACLLIAFSIATSPYALGIPFVLNGVLALLAVFSHWHNLFIAIPLFLIGMLLVLYRGRQSAAT
jgi:hypothetical protein